MRRRLSQGLSPRQNCDALVRRPRHRVHKLQCTHGLTGCRGVGVGWGTPEHAARIFRGSRRARRYIFRKHKLAGTGSQPGRSRTFPASYAYVHERNRPPLFASCLSAPSGCLRSLRPANAKHCTNNANVRIYFTVSSSFPGGLPWAGALISRRRQRQSRRVWTVQTEASGLGQCRIAR